MHIQDANRIHYLDGLRGWAALIVCLHHTALTFTFDVPKQPLILYNIQNGYLKILLDGTLSVKIFFVLSGIVISMAFIKNRDFKKLASLLIKRIPRLGIPIFAMALISHLLMKLGLIYNLGAIDVLENNTWLAMCYNFDSSIFKVIEYTFLNTFFGNGNPYSTALWTMPYEMLGSVFVVIVLLAASHIKKNKIYIPLIILFVSLIVLAYRQGDSPSYSSAFICFLSGILLSYYIARKNTQCTGQDKQTSSKQINKEAIIRFICKILLFALIVWLYYHPSGLDLKKDLIAILIVLFVIISPVSQRILSNKVSVFLGKISFPLYVIHMTVICSLTSFLIIKEYDPANIKLVLLYFVITVIASIISACILYPVEKFSINFSRKLFEYLSTDDRINLKDKFVLFKK